MTPSPFFLAGSAALLCLAAAATAASPASASRPGSAGPAGAAGAKPNIIFILTDDLGWGDVGVFYQNARRAAGAPAELTPALDRMAAQGVRFTDQYSAAPVCAPSRASILLGVDQGHANVRDNQFDKALENNHTLATVLREAGYATAAIGKWGLQGVAVGGAPHWPAHPLNRGFDFYYGYIRHRDGHQHYPKDAPWPNMDEKVAHRDLDPTAGPGPGKQVWDNYTEVSAQLDKCYTTDLFTARAKKWIVDQTAHDPARPFFLYLAYDTPHAVIEVPTQAYPAGGGLQGGLQWRGEAGHMINTASGKVDSYIYPEFPRQWPEVYRRYASAVHRIDDCVGDLFQLLKDLKIDDNTLVVFTSDNGPSNEAYLPWPNSPQFFGGYGPFDGIKRDCWEGGMREPTIVRWPGAIPAGRVSAFPSGLWDWLPTFTAAAGLPPPARTSGVSLLPTLTGIGAQRDPGYLYFEYQYRGRTPNYPEFEPGHRGRWRNQMQALRIGDLVGVRYDIKSANDDFELYDVVHDPKEAHNLAKDPNYAQWEPRLKEKAIQSRRPDPGAKRPYDNELMAPATPVATVPGLSWKYYEGSFPWVPDFEALIPTAQGGAPEAALAVRHRDDNIGLLFAGYLNVPADGDYTFYLSADTGAFLRIHDASVIDADYGYASGSTRSGTVKLKAGLHPFRLYYLRRAGAPPALNWQWQGPGFSRQPIPATAFSH